MMTTPAPLGKVVSRYKIHWHVMFTHFPVSFFTVSALFMVLHLFTETECFELSSYITLIAGAASLVPTILTGWNSWKKNYKGAKVKIFKYKIRISYAILALSIVLIIFHGLLANTAIHSIWHYIYGVGFVVLFLGAMAEGYYGGRLNHR